MSRQCKAGWLICRALVDHQRFVCRWPGANGMLTQTNRRAAATHCSPASAPAAATPHVVCSSSFSLAHPCSTSTPAHLLQPHDVVGPKVDAHQQRLELHEHLHPQRAAAARPPRLLQQRVQHLQRLWQGRGKG